MGEMVGSKLCISFFTGGIIAWLVIGSIAGWLVGLMMKGSGYGIIGDIVVGLIERYLPCRSARYFRGAFFR